MRPIIVADLAWMVPIFKQRYSNQFDVEESLRWMTNVVLASPHVFYAARSEHAFAITLLTFPPWIPERRDAYLVVVAAATGHIWECFGLLRDSIAWAKKRACATWNFQSDTNFPVAPLMRRLGITQAEPRYRLDLEATA